MVMDQLELDFSVVIVVQNHWGSGWHLMTDDGFAVEGSPSFFETRESALEWARKMGVVVERPGGR